MLHLKTVGSIYLAGEIPWWKMSFNFRAEIQLGENTSKKGNTTYIIKEFLVILKLSLCLTRVTILFSIYFKCQQQSGYVFCKVCLLIYEIIC